jgi:hypothetical protein
MKKTKLETLEDKLLYVADQLNGLVQVHSTTGATEDDLVFYKTLVKILLNALSQARMHDNIVSNFKTQYQFNRFLSDRIYSLELEHHALINNITNDSQNSQNAIHNQKPS